MRRLTLALLFLSVGVGGYAAGSVDSREAVAQSAQTYEQLAVFGEVLGLLQTRYVEAVDDRELVRAGIRGMLGELDPHTVFLDPQQLQAMRDDTRGEYVGVGIMIRNLEEGIEVTEVFEGGPARDAGVRIGDLIVTVDGASVIGLDTPTVVDLLRGPRGERVVLGIERTIDEGDTTEHEIAIIRDLIHTAAVEAELVAPGIGHVRIRSFQTNTGGEVRTAIDRMQAEYGDELEGVVLDLRDNPGGLLSEAVSVADAFVSDGIIVSTGGRLDADEGVSEASRSATRYDGPLVVLVNGGSASASEVVAGALQDQARGPIFGTQSYGKGSVQTIVDLQDGSGLKLTISLYYTPSGRSINGTGITPDMVVEGGDVEAGEGVAGAIVDRQLRAAVEHLLQP